MIEDDVRIHLFQRADDIVLATDHGDRPAFAVGDLHQRLGQRAARNRLGDAGLEPVQQRQQDLAVADAQAGVVVGAAQFLVVLQLNDVVHVGGDDIAVIVLAGFGEFPDQTGLVTTIEINVEDFHITSLQS